MSVDIRPNESNADYHADHAHVSNSMLSVFARSPEMFRRRFVDGGIESPPPSDEMLLGSVVHTLLLEPDKFDAEYVDTGLKDRRTSAWKESARHASETGKIALTGPLVAKARCMHESILSSAIATMVLYPLEAAMKELSIRWIDGATMLPCKARLDLVYETWRPEDDGRTMVIDLKTSRDPTPREFNRSAWKYGYRRQAAWYCRAASKIGLDVADFMFVVVGSEEPHDVHVYRVDHEDIDHARGEMDDLMQQLLLCHESGMWISKEQRTIQTLGEYL